MISVLHICQRDDLATGGAARVAVELVKMQRQTAGMEAHCLFVYGNPGPFGKELGSSAKYLRACDGRNAWTAGIQLSKQIQALKPTLIHHHDGLLWTHMVTAVFRSTPKIGHAHLPPPSARAPWKHRVANALHRWVYDHLICVSTATREEWCKAGYPANRCSTVTNAVDRVRFRPPSLSERAHVRSLWGIGENSFVLGFVGRLHSQMKGCDCFLELLASLPESTVGVVAGTGPDELALRQLARNLKLQNRIHFLGSVDPATEAFWGFDLFLMTSTDEPFGLALLEAAACGVPSIVLPASGGVIELAKNIGATIVPSRDIDCIKQIVLGHLRTDEHRFAPNLYDLSPYSWELTADNVSKCYHHALAQHRAGGSN